MPKRGRRAGVSFIEDGRGRSLTFFKRRSGLFKAASDLSTLTGVRVAVVLESENERFSSFGTPDASPIVDAFLSGGVPTESDTSEEQKAKITNLQNELFHLEKEKAMADKRQRENTVRIKEAQVASQTAKYAYGKEEDLDATELYEMYRKLTWVMQEIKDCSPALLRANHVEAGGRLRDPSLLMPRWWCSPPASQFVPPPPPPKYSPLSLSQASFQQHPWSSTSRPMLARSGSSSFPIPLMLPSQQMQSELQQHPLAPHAPSMVRPQAPPPKEAYPYNYYHIHGLDINGNNNSLPFSFSPVSPATPPQPPSSLQTPPSDGSSPPLLSPQLSSPPHLESPQFSFNPQNYTFAQPPHHNYANASSPIIPSHQPFYSSSLGLNADLGNTGGGHNKGFDLSTTQQQGHGGAGVILESSSAGESSGAGNAAGSNLGDFNFPSY